MKIEHSADLLEAGTTNDVRFTVVREHLGAVSFGEPLGGELTLIFEHGGSYSLRFDAREVYDFLVAAGVGEDR